MRTATLAAVLASLALAACVDAPSVVQGTVQSFDPDARRLVLVDSERGGQVEIVIATADIGGEPSPGDVVRVAYFERDGRRVATRVMNVTRQEGLRGSGGH